MSQLSMASFLGSSHKDDASCADLSKVSCTFVDTRVELSYLWSTLSARSLPLAACLVAAGAVGAALVGLQYGVLSTVDVVFAATSMLLMVWGFVDFLIAMRLAGPKHVQLVTDTAALRRFRDCRLLQATNGVCSLLLMLLATMWAFVEPNTSTTSSSTFTLRATSDDTSLALIVCVSAVVGVPVALGVSYQPTLIAHIVWMTVFTILNLLWSTPQATLKAVLAALVIVVLLQLVHRRMASLSRHRWFAKSVMDSAPSPAGSHISEASSAHTAHKRAPVLERLVSMLHRIRRATVNPQIAGDLDRVLQLLYENPSALTACWGQGHDDDDSVAGWVTTLVRHVPSFSAAGRRRDATMLLQRQTSERLDSSDDEFDGVTGRPRSLSRDYEFRKMRSRSPPPTPHGVVKKLLGSIELWDFDVFEFSDVAEGRPLASVMHYAFDKYDISKRHRIAPAALAAFVNKLEWEYCYSPARRNPYHNNLHATDVTQAVIHFLSLANVKSLVDDVDVFSVILAAAVHDFRHPGVTNNYLVATESKLALRYNDMSILENFHASEAFRCMRHRDHNILRGMQAAELLTLRFTVIQCVLATDLAVGPQYMADFAAKFRRRDFGGGDEDKLLMLQLAIKCADVSHPCRPLRLHMRWSHLISKEFYLQGDTEREMGLPVSPLCDRHNADISKSQIGFMEFVVRPCFAHWSEFCMEERWLKQLETNLTHWSTTTPSSGTKAKPVRDEEDDDGTGPHMRQGVLEDPLADMLPGASNRD